MGAPRKGHRKAAAETRFLAALAAVQSFLEALNRPATIIGGVAVIAHGFARFTADIDASVAAEPADVRKLLAAGRRAGLYPRIARAEAFARENLVLLLEHRQTRTPVDLSLALQPFELQAAREAKAVTFKGVRIRVPSLTALLTYKMLAGRPQDLKDVEALLESREAFDPQRVEQILREFDALLETDRAGDFRRILEAR